MWRLRPLSLEVYGDDVNFAMGDLFGGLAPVALFLHAHFCFTRGGAALRAALVVTALPQYVRFSHLDTDFAQALVVGALGFSLLYATLREDDANRRWQLGAATAPRAGSPSNRPSRGLRAERRGARRGTGAAMTAPRKLGARA